MTKEKHDAVQAELTQIRNSIAVHEANVAKGDMEDKDLDALTKALHSANEELDPNQKEKSSAKKDDHVIGQSPAPKKP